MPSSSHDLATAPHCKLSGVFHQDQIEHASQHALVVQIVLQMTLPQALSSANTAQVDQQQGVACTENCVTSMSSCNSCTLHSKACSSAGSFTRHRTTAKGHGSTRQPLEVCGRAGGHLSMEEDIPLRPSVRVPRHPDWTLEGLILLPERASTPAVERGIGLQSSTSALLTSLAASASENL